MSKRKTNADPEDAQEQPNHNSDIQNLETNSAAHSLSRRSFLSRAGASTVVVAATSVGLPSMLSENAQGQIAEGQIAERAARRDRSFQIRLNAATRESKLHVPPQINNGDEARYSNFIGNFSQGLPHNSIGEVDPTAYQALLTAVASGKPDDFAKIPLGGTVKLSGPQGGLAFDLEGTDSGQLTIPPSPTLAGAERAGEMVEDYWMALARDIPFSQYGNEPITAAAIADLNNLSLFRGPKVSGQVTPATLFRGFTPADLIGPYLSQFFLMPISMGTLSITQKFNTYTADADYLTDFTSWLAVQNGSPSGTVGVVGPTYIKDGRDLGAWVRGDFTFQACLFATQWLIGNKVPYNPGNPYLNSANQVGVQTFGPQHILDLLGEVSNRALKAMWYQKWFVHRALRPIAYGGLVNNTLTGVAKYPLHRDVLNSQAVAQVFKKNNNGYYFLPAAYPEGNPQHPSYAEGHGVIAGACVTALKAFFNETFVIPNPVVPSDDGQSLLPYTGSDAGQMTVGVELNKLANNVGLGRDMAGVHWRSDVEQALLLGEKITISILRDQRHTYNEPFSGFTFTRFDGTTITV